MQRLTHGYGLVEGPLWVPDRGLMFSDVHGGGVFCLAEDGTVASVFPHRRGIGGLALHAAGGLVVGGRNIAFKGFDGGDTVILLDRDPGGGNVGYNDLTTDAAGRIYVGSLGSPVFEAGEQLPGNLHLIDVDGSSRVVATDVLLTNGLGFSPDGSILYHSDSRRRTVFRYAVRANGDLGERQAFARLDNGAPDGLAVSEDGAVWVAVAGGGCVAVFEPDAALRERIEVPMPMCTSVCFGGEGLKDLYVVTGSDGVAGDREGGVYRVRGRRRGPPGASLPGTATDVGRKPLKYIRKSSRRGGPCWPPFFANEPHRIVAPGQRHAITKTGGEQAPPLRPFAPTPPANVRLFPARPRPGPRGRDAYRKPNRRGGPCWPPFFANEPHRIVAPRPTPRDHEDGRGASPAPVPFPTLRAARCGAGRPPGATSPPPVPRAPT